LPFKPVNAAGLRLTTTNQTNSNRKSNKRVYREKMIHVIFLMQLNAIKKFIAGIL
jgi:hypothetical protein